MSADPHNPYAAPSGQSPPPQPAVPLDATQVFIHSGDPHERIREYSFEVAKAQRYLCWALLAAFILAFVTVPVRMFAGDLVVWLLPLQLASSVANLSAAYRLGSSVHRSAAFGVWMAILAFIPCIGIIALLIVNAQATSRLQKNGYQVGLLGADLAQFDPPMAN
jgi:hypothetical protein